MTREEYVRKYTALCDLFAKYGVAADGASICREVLADFEAVTSCEDSELVSLEVAANRSGYHKDHLRRLARIGKLPATRRGRRLLFRVGDLPRKPTFVDVQPIRAYDPIADARRVATRTSHGGNHG